MQKNRRPRTALDRHRFRRIHRLSNLAAEKAAVAMIQNPVSMYSGDHLQTAVRPVRIDCPTAVAMFPREVMRVPRSAAERKYDLRRWTEFPRGGHFAAMEQPEALVADIRAFFRDFRDYRDIR